MAKNEEKKKEEEESLFDVDPWDSICDFVEEKGGAPGHWISQHLLRRLSVEAPVIVGFVFICVVIHILENTIWPGISIACGVDDHILWKQPFMQCFRMFSHIFAHDGLQHIRGNVTNLLLVGPSAENAFGSKALLQIMAMVAISSGFAHILFGYPHTRQLGASGVVFALILLNSLVAAKGGKIPISFLMNAGLWVTDEIWRFFFYRKTVSHHAHLTGALVGTLMGYYLHRQNEEAKLKKITSAWRAKSSSKKD